MEAVDAQSIGRFLVIAGIVLVAVGGVFLVGSALGLGRLPGDVSFGSGNLRIYVPLATCVVVSIVATIILNVIARR